ncbi:hypothetical protein ASG01_06205 [Chryseobacterium sp. Leaf180]|uniref:DUF5689 domain-containing protein n=1 Tax=Chryseobacterium sp. Leaf180 TaxID=1736289 RepID=UPI0006FB0FA4|nr:DUF5689 domain-containing protein [Chryseobacterium sp. Leaf180]KQR95434.1 hypothetical protein ASG01_06205 [Chryseobacterium sp. Leaf180]
MNKTLKFLVFIFLLIQFAGCVHDDSYQDPDLDGYMCADLTPNLTLSALKAKYANAVYVFPENSTEIVEGYVSSTDETGNIYKTIYIQDKPENPTQGFVISVDLLSVYTKFPQGSKIYIKLAGLAVGVYGGVVQLGIQEAGSSNTTAVSRIPEPLIKDKIFRSCTVREKIVPFVLTSAQMVSANDRYIGCLIQMNDAEFDSRVLCTTFAPPGVTEEKIIRDASSTSARIVRNSGFASFANQILPAGNGKFVGIYSKYNSTYQLFINKVSDLEMNNFPRLDGITANPCEYSDAGLTQKTVAEIKQLYTGTLSTVSGDFVLKAKVTGNDKSGNLYKYLFVEDASGGIRINIDKLDLYNDARFMVGKELYVKLKNLVIGNVSGEIQLGAAFNGSVGRIPEQDVYKYFFDSNKISTNVVATEKQISQLTTADVGKFITIKNLQFITSDLERKYAGAIATNRTFEDCNGNQITLRTSNFADFASEIVESGRGDVKGILGIFNGSFQLTILDLLGADLDLPRCDGSVYETLPTLYTENFAVGGFSTDWSIVNVLGTQTWATSNVSNGNDYYAVINGFSGGNTANEDWLISKPVSLAGKSKAALSFVSDVRYAGNSLQVYATDNYTGNPATTVWFLLPATLDSNNLAFGDWVNSGNVSLNAFLGKNVRIAFKYTSTSFSAATWQIDEFKIKGN